jgi:hypothetical protein
MEPFAPPPLGFDFTGELFEWTSNATSWWFIRMPVDQSAELREEMDGLTNGFGSVRVEVTIGSTTWRTSLFPSSADKQYLLPVKKQVRTTEKLIEGEPIEVSLTVLLAG